MGTYGEWRWVNRHISSTDNLSLLRVRFSAQSCAAVNMEHGIRILSMPLTASSEH